jgi:hypothetical protein
MNDWPIYLFAVFFLVLGLFTIWYSLPSSKGLVGEWLVQNVLKKLANKYRGFEIKDIMIGQGNSSTQIDNILITRKAIYVFEVKNYMGRVYGNQYQEQWYQTIRYENKRKGRGGKTYTKTHIEKNAFFNPIKQNIIHVEALKNTIESIKNKPIFNIVVFMNQTNLNNIEMVDSKAVVIKRGKIAKTVSNFEKSLNDLNLDPMIVWEEILTKNTKSKKNFKEHIQKIKAKYGK